MLSDYYKPFISTIITIEVHRLNTNILLTAILLNFRLALTAKVMVAVAVFFTYCLQMYAPMDIIWTRLRDRVSKKYHNVSQMALRTISVTFTGKLALIAQLTSVAISQFLTGYNMWSLP